MLKFVMSGIALVFGLAAASPLQAQQLTPPATESTATLTESQKVQQLIDWVRHLEGATFIRNGKAYKAGQAADHLQSKWEKHKDEVKTAEAFIQVLASRSGRSGQDYLIRYADGKTVTSGEALRQQLQRLEQQ